MVAPPTAYLCPDRKSSLTAAAQPATGEMFMATQPDTRALRSGSCRSDASWTVRAAALALLLLPSALLAQGRANDLDTAAIVADVEASRRAWSVPGAAIAVTNIDRTLMAQGLGVRSTLTREPVDADTIFQINSMTKSFTGLMVAALDHGGVVRLDDPIAKHLPWFRLYDPYVTATATLEDALVHRLGLDESIEALEDVPGVTLEDFARRLAQAGPMFPVRSRFSYSSAFTVAGLAAGGEEGWEARLTRTVLQPLGLKRALPDIRRALAPEHVASCHECQPPIAPAGEAALRDGWTNFATPHVEHGTNPDHVLTPNAVPGHWRVHPPAGPNANMAISANDLAAYLRGLLQSRAGRPGAPFPAEVVNNVLRPRIAEPEVTLPPLPARFREAERRRREFARTSYALGWSCGTYGGQPICYHSGGSLGFESFMALLPEQGYGVAVLSNFRLDLTGFIDAALMKTLDRLVGLPPVDWDGFARELVKADAAAAEERIRARRQGLPRLPRLSRPETLAGTYRHPVLGPVSVTATRGELEVAFGPQRRAQTRHLAANVYELRWLTPRNDPRPLEFELAADGVPAALRLDGLRFERDRAR